MKLIILLSKFIFNFMIIQIKDFQTAFLASVTEEYSEQKKRLYHERILKIH